MIKYGCRDLFGGQTTVVCSEGFSCIIETVGDGLCQQPSTTVRDLAQASGLTDFNLPTLKLKYDSVFSGEGLLAHHKTIADYLDALGEGDRHATLETAFKNLTVEFRYFGSWSRVQPAQPAFNSIEKRLKTSPLRPQWIDRDSLWTQKQQPKPMHV
ncbi:MAG: hypothetical protein JWR26_4660 [Pedosphaera sp.]|nr:hypothetical protein [Pedosphaera sp.]